MSPDRIAETGEISYLNLALRESSKYPKKSTACQERCFSHVKEEIPPAGEIEAFASLSRKAAGSQGSALSRIPQDAESPLETRGSARVSTKNNFKRRPQAVRLFCAQSALMKTNLRIGFQFCCYRLIPEQSGGLETLLRRRTKARDGQPTVFHPLQPRFPLSSGLL